MKNLIATEEQEQIALFQWIETQPAIRNFIFAIPNGGLRNKAVASKLKKQGVKAGIPDIFMPVPLYASQFKCSEHKNIRDCEKYRCIKVEFDSIMIKAGLFIELKRKKASKVTDQQKEWLLRLENFSYEVAICYGWEEARDIILNYKSRQNESIDDQLAYMRLIYKITTDGLANKPNFLQFVMEHFN